MRPIEDWYLPQDGDDISHAWRRCMEGGDGLDPIRTDSSELGGTVVFGAKTYWARSTMHVTRRMRIVGEGAYNTRIFSVECTAFHVRFRNDVTSPRVGNGGQETTIEHLAVQYSGARTPGIHGIRFDAKAHAQNIEVHAFTGDGIHIVGDVTVQPQTGANTCSLYAVRCVDVDGAGFYLAGGDSNASTFVHCDASNAKAGGFWDRSFLGNFFLGCHSNNKRRGADWWSSEDGQMMPATSTKNASMVGGLLYPHALICIRPSARSHVIMYAEGNNLVDVRPPSFCYPVQGGTVTPESEAAYLRPLTSHFVLPKGAQAAGVGSSSSSVALAPNAQTAMELRSPLDTFGYGFARETNGPLNGWWTMRRANSQGQAPLAFRADAKAGATAAVWAPKGMMMGEGVMRRTMAVVQSPPDVSTATVGDLLLAAYPTATLDGWRCVDEGNGPFWRPFVWSSPP